MARDGHRAKLRDKVRLSITPEGLRIEILDEADFAMFDIGTNRLSRAAAELLVEVGGAISTLPNPIAMRGHTDSLPYNPRPGTPQGMNNWILRSEEHTSELQSLMRISYAVLCLKKKNKENNK